MIGRGVRGQVHLESCDEAPPEVELGGAHRDARRDVRDRLVADPLVDDVRGFPEFRDVEPGRVTEALERFCKRLSRDAVERQRERIDRGGDEVGTGVDCGQCGCEADARGALDVEPDGKLARLLIRATSSCAACGRSAPVGSFTTTLVAPRSGALARLLDEHVGPPARLGCRRPAWNAPPALVIAAPASRRFETSFSGSWRRKTSMPFSAAHDTKRPTMSPRRGASRRGSGRAARSRAASRRGAAIARMRSHGLSTRRRTVASKTPPPETSRHAKPAPSRISATRKTSAVGSLPARGSCESRRSWCRPASAPPGRLPRRCRRRGQAREM